MKALRASHETDPAEEIRRAVGDLSGVEFFNNQVLIGVYVRPEKTGSGLYLPDRTRDEDKWQGKVGLVLAKGPLAFQDDEHVQFHGQNVAIGDWIVYRPSDGWQITINDHPCRLLEEVHIRARVSEPDLVY
jgi:co-chaperonin GroES (HSP10)